MVAANLDLGVDTCGEKGKVDVIVTQVYGQIGPGEYQILLVFGN